MGICELDYYDFALGEWRIEYYRFSVFAHLRSWWLARKKASRLAMFEVCYLK